MFKDLEKKKIIQVFKGGIVRDPMFVVCCVINNNTLNYEVI